MTTMVSNKTLIRLGFFMTLLTLALVMLGAFVRLSDAGLGCPDWPGCYGHVGVPNETHEIATAHANYERPVEAPKAWKEMIHRYVAGTLGVLVALLAFFSWQRRRQPEQETILPLMLVVLVVFQALLGMWTVTLKLLPIVVSAHLMGGIATLSLIWLFTLRQSRWLASPEGLSSRTASYLRPWAIIALLVVIIQIFLGGWTSANYSALACTDFPTCGGHWLPPTLNFAEAFTLWHPVGEDYEYALHLSPETKTTIHFVHRVGALITFFILIDLIILTFVSSVRNPLLKQVALVMLALLFIQISLGVSNVMLQLPLWIAVLHNGGAALLLLSVITFNYVLYPPQSRL
jgi:cytochrome c oxidase assembly protein subunit 15